MTIVSFHYGAGNNDELKSLKNKSALIVGVSSLTMLVLAWLLASSLSKIFVGYDEILYKLTMYGFIIYALSLLFSRVAIFGSAFFTALNDGLTSALISFLRPLLFQVVAVIVFPLIWGLDGIWISIVAAEFMAAAVTVIFIIAKRHKFNY